MMENNSTEVILMGGNHHNGLGLVRCFGKHGIHPYGILIGNGAEDSFVKKSKYWKKVWCVKTDIEAIELLEKELVFADKALIIPWSDGAAKEIDINYDRLKDYFILPSIKNTEGEIFKLMNKESQVDLVNSFGINMLSSNIISLVDHINAPGVFPVILKPVTSVEGSKDDMAICYSLKDYENSISELKNKGFSRILVQKYLPEKKEYVVTGAISEKSISFSVVRHIRVWPPKFGTGSYSEIVVDALYDDYCESVLKKIQNIGFTGNIDFEFFEDNQGSLYVNEINWRSSGRNFVSQFTGVDSAYIYYCDIIGKTCKLPLTNKKHGYSMNEATDFKHVLKRKITLLGWISDLVKTRSFAVWSVKDLAPTLRRYVTIISKGITGKYDV